MFSFRFFSLCFVVLLPLHLVYFDYAPVNVNPVGGGGGGRSAGKGWGFDKFLNFWIKFNRVGNERSMESVRKAPTPGEKI